MFRYEDILCRGEKQQRNCDIVKGRNSLKY